MKASIFYESYQVKNNGDSCKKLEETDRKWLNIACNLVQMHLIFAKIEVSHLCVFICLFGVLRCFQHCTGYITTGSWKGRGNQYI